MPQSITSILPLAKPSASSEPKPSLSTSPTSWPTPQANSLPTLTSNGPLPVTTNPDALALQQRYPTAAQLLAAYSPDRVAQVLDIRDERRIYLGQAPTFNVIAQAYGINHLLSWLEIQLAALAEYAGVREKMTPQSLHLLAATIAREYWWLKLSEFMAFIGEMMSGTYGHFYGAVDPMVIGKSLQYFIRKRQDILDRIERQDRQRAEEAELQESAKKACSHREWQARKEIIGYILTGLLQKSIHE